MAGVLVSCGCDNKLGKPGDLKRQKLILSQFRMPDIWSQGDGGIVLLPPPPPPTPGGSRRESVPCFSQLLVTVVIPYKVTTPLFCLRLCITFPSDVCVLSLSVSYVPPFFFCLIRMLIIGFKANAGIPEWAHLEIPNLHLQWLRFPIKTHSQVPVVRMWTYLLEGHCSMHAGG